MIIEGYRKMDDILLKYDQAVEEAQDRLKKDIEERCKSMNVRDTFQSKLDVAYRLDPTFPHGNLEEDGDGYVCVFNSSVYVSIETSFFSDPKYTLDIVEEQQEDWDVYSVTVVIVPV